MRIFVCALALAGCTTENPLFGHSGTSAVGGEAGTDGGATMGGQTTTTGTTGIATIPDAGVDVTTAGGVTTDDPPPNCCDPNACDPTIEDCLCGLSPVCCEGPWAGNCLDIAIACGASCMDAPRPCCSPHPEPGCEGVIVDVEGFCQANATCCTETWRPECVAAYDAATGACGLGSCLMAHATPLCNDAAVLACICPERPQCCEEAWDETCADKVAQCPL